MQDRNKSDSVRTTMVCVDSCSNKIYTGRYYNYGHEGEGHNFSSFVDLVLGMENALDEANFPQSFTSKRSFANAADAKSAASMQQDFMKKGECATFVIKVLFRQHTSWQGSVTWLEKGEEQPFRSVLELMLLMDSALEA